MGWGWSIAMIDIGGRTRGVSIHQAPHLRSIPGFSHRLARRSFVYSGAMVSHAGFDRFQTTARHRPHLLIGILSCQA